MQLRDIKMRVVEGTEEHLCKILVALGYTPDIITLKMASYIYCDSSGEIEYGIIKRIFIEDPREEVTLEELLPQLKKPKSLKD